MITSRPTSRFSSASIRPCSISVASCAFATICSASAIACCVLRLRHRRRARPGLLDHPLRLGVRRGEDVRLLLLGVREFRLDPLGVLEALRDLFPARLEHVTTGL